MKIYKHLLVSLLFSLIFFSAYSQCPTPLFSSPASVCLSEKISFQNNSINSTSYYWDFCSNDLETSPVATSLFAPANTIVQPLGYKTIFSQGKWYGFITSSSNHLVRADFGADLTNNSPLYTDLGNVGGILAQVEDIDLLEVNGNWYAVIAQNNFSGAVLIDFGSNIENPAPTSTLLGSFFTGAKIRGVSLAYDGSRILMVLCSASNFIEVVNFGNSFYNTLSASDIMAVSISGSSPIFSVDILHTCNSWYVYASTLSSGGLIHRVQFGTDLFTTPVGIITYTIPAVQNPIGINILTEGAKTYLAVSNSGTPYVLVDFGDIAANDSPGIVASANTTGTIFTKVNGFAYQGKFIFLGVDFASPVITSLTFANACGQSTEYSTLATPAIISYATSGATPVLLSSSDGEITNQVTNSIAVSALVAPTIDFTTANVCVNKNVNFTPQGSLGAIACYAWNFGDGGTSLVSNPSYTYSIASTYTVEVKVTASNGCKNSSQRQLQIFNVPQANFNLPAALPICTNQNYLFSNSSTFDSGSNPTWQWNVNGTNIAVSQDLSYLIPSTVAQNVTLTASIPGCNSQSAQSIPTVQDGPLVNFSSAANGCVNSVVSFTNSSAGTISSYHWDFGDGNSSSQTNATNTYSSGGNFAVTLTASNAAGCQNFLTKNFPVYTNPLPDFAIESPPYSCANYPAQFDNNTPPLSDSNITTWTWNFGDAANGTSNQKNPAYTFAAATTYNVTLQAISNFGCTGSKLQSVIIYPSPQAGFTNTPACVNQSTQFTDASSGNITSYQWVIQSIILTGPNPPPYVFKSSGTFPATLTTTSGNGCKNQVVKNINVPVPPVMDFIFQPSCTGKPTVFQELNPGGQDPSVAWNWNFGSGSGTGSPVSYSFTTAGPYSVTLSATRSSGCVYSTSKNITIYEGPVARFTPSEQSGPAPLTVTCNNTSTADAYFWNTGVSTSNEVSPEFTFTELGEYKVLLIASNIHGCIDTTSTKIYVVVPRVDLAMKNFSLVEDPNSNSSKPVVTILNLGNTPLTNPEVQIDLGGNALLKEKIIATVLPGKSIQQTLSLQIVPRALGYICAEVAPTGDVNIYNNRQCLSMTSNDVLFYPYPNPASGQINFDWISSENENVTVTIYKSTGQVAFKQDFQMIQSGINQLAIDISSLSSGLYLIQFSGAKTKRTFSVSVVN